MNHDNRPDREESDGNNTGEHPEERRDVAGIDDGTGRLSKDAGRCLSRVRLPDGTERPVLHVPGVRLL
jgi:hypothetical protein